MAAGGRVSLRFPDRPLLRGASTSSRRMDVVTLYIDIETRARVNLPAVGVYRYVTDPDFRILMMDWSDDDGATIHHTEDVDEMLAVPGLLDPTVEKVAHNAQFERVCFSAALGLPPGRYLPPREWRDTAALAAELGFPRSLEAAAHAVGGEQKDTAGAALIRMFSQPNKSGGWNGPDTHPERWAEFAAYCRQDVATLISLDHKLRELGDWPTDEERLAYTTDALINDRGIAIDVELARTAAAVARSITHEQEERVRELTLWEVDNPSSALQLRQWLASKGLRLPNMKASTVRETLRRTDLSPQVREVLELRQELALAAPAKFGAALASVVGGRLRGTLLFYGAHTGRWAGRGVQPQNLPRDSFAPNEDDMVKLEHMRELGFPESALEEQKLAAVDRVTEQAIAAIKRRDRVSARTLKRAVRPLFLVDGVVVDYSSIEARVIAWLAGEEWALEAFRAGRDIYVETARAMGGLTRPQGKIAVLALGYGGGAGSLRVMAGEHDYLPGGQRLIKDAPEAELYERFVNPWRAANSRIVALWHRLETAFAHGGPAGPHLFVREDRGGRDRLIELPSGRFVAYRNVQVRPGRPPRFTPTITFTTPSTPPFRVETYGGRLAENVTQAVARDVLSAAIIRLEQAGLRVVSHIHDEILVEGTADVDLVRKIMCEPTDWSTGLPIDAEGFATYRYKKG